MSVDSARHYFRHFSWPIPAAMGALLVISVLAVHLAEQAEGGPTSYARRQALFAVLTVGAFVAGTMVPYRRVGQASYGLFALTLVLLVVVFACRPVRGSYRWIPIPGLIKFQPSEVAKLTFIIALAWYLRFRDSYRRLLGLIVPFAITLLPLGLILMEPDLGTSLLLLPALMVMLFAAGAKLRHLLVIVALGAAVVFTPIPRPVNAAAFAAERGRFDASALGPVTFYRPSERRGPDGSIDWQHRPVTPVAYCRGRLGDGGVYDLQPLSLVVITWMGNRHQIRRIEGWLRQDDPRIRANLGYQQYHSMMILGSGQWAGRGTWRSASGYFRMLPDDHTDFIFSVIGGQWGFIGCAGVLVLYAIILLFGADVALSTPDPFGRLLAVGMLALLSAQIFINVGMTVGLMPITGMTLPLVSYGGSSLLVNGLALGLLVNVGRHRPVSLAPKPFEHDGAVPEQISRITPPLPDRVIDGRMR